MKLKIMFAALAALACAPPAMAQVLSSDQVTGQPGAVQGTASDGKRIELPVYVPVRADGSVIDAAGGTGASAQQVQGPSADLATQVGNPVPVGCEFLTTQPTLTNGQGGQLRCTGRNELLVTLSNGANPAPIAAATTSTIPNTAVGLYANSFGRIVSGSNWYAAAGNTAGQQYVVQALEASTTSGVAPVVTAAVAGGQVLKASAGNLYGLNVVSGASAGYVLVTNTTTVPADGAVTPLKCYAIPATSSLDLNLRAAPVYFSTGISVSFSTTGCFTKTASATAFISGDVK